MEHGCIKDQWPEAEYIHGVRGILLSPYSNLYQAAKPSQEPPMSSKAPNWDLQDINVLGTFEIKIESKNLEHGCMKDQCPYPNQNQHATPPSGNSSLLQSPISGLKRHGCTLHLQNQDIEQKFRSWVYQRSVTISKARSRYQTLFKNLHNPPKPKIRTYRTLMFLAPS